MRGELNEQAMLQGRTYMNAEQAFEDLFGYAMSEGNYVAGTKALYNVSFSMLKPNENLIRTPWRKWNPDYAKLEFDWYKTGERDPKMVEAKAKLWSTMKDDSGYVNSNYGWWWQRNDQLEHAIRRIRNNYDTRQAVVLHFNPDDVLQYNKDMPCNIGLNFYVRKGELNLTIWARSIDLVYGFCNDQYCFSRLLLDVTKELGCKLGSMHYFITNLHVYEKHYRMRIKDQLNLPL